MFSGLSKLKQSITDWCVSPTKTTVGAVHQSAAVIPCEIYDPDTDDLKFIERADQRDLFVKTPTGYSRVKQSLKTVPYNVWTVRTATKSIQCADKHIVIDGRNNQRHVDSLVVGQYIQTADGLERIIHVSEDVGRSEHMYDLELDDDQHVYYTNGILSHNSTISCIYLLWFAIFHFEKTVLIASNKNENAMEMIYRIKFVYERLPQWLKPGIEADGYNKHALGFDNGSRIHSTATSETSGRGMSISLLFCDEFAFVRDSTAEEFWTSIAPTLATGGSCIIASTPNGDSNLYAQLWRGAQAGVNGFFPIEVKWNEPPGRDEKFKKEEMGKLGKIRWLQEYECEMLSTDPLLFDSLMLTNLTAVTDKITPIGTAGDIVFYEQPQPGATYLVGVDPATGSGNDFATIQVFSFPAMEQVAEWRSNTVSSVILYHTLKKILLLLEKNESTVYFSVENNGVGEALIALYTADEHPPSADFVSEDGQKRQGMTTTGRSKIQACLSFKDMIERGAMTIRSSNLLKEMKNYARKAGSYAAKRGATDDLIAACLIVVRLVTEISSYDDDAYNKLYAGAHHVEAEDIDYDDSDYGVDFVM